MQLDSMTPRLRRRRMGSLNLAWAAAMACVTVMAQSKVDPNVWEKAKEGSAVLVFVELQNQPQADIFRRVREGYRARIDSAEKRYQQLAGPPFLPSPQLRLAREELDALTVEVRDEAGRQIEAEIGPQQDYVKAKLLGLGAANILHYRAINMLAAHIPASSLVALEQIPEISRISLVDEGSGFGTSNLEAIHADAFWSVPLNGSGQSVAVVDSAIDTHVKHFDGYHPAAPRQHLFYLNRSGKHCVAGPDPHGTEVASVITGRGEADPGLIVQGLADGVGEDGGSIWSLEVLCYTKAAQGHNPPEEESNGADILDAFSSAILGRRYQEGNPIPVDALAAIGTRIFNLSVGGASAEDYPPVAKGLDSIIQMQPDVSVVVAAGNLGGGEKTIGDSGAAFNVITVGGMDTKDTDTRADDEIYKRPAAHPLWAGDSSIGPTIGGRKKPDLVAPGDFVPIALMNNKYDAGSGTSFAAPHVTGTVDLLWQAGVTNGMGAKALIINSAHHDYQGGHDFLGWRKDTGWGYLDLEPLLAQVQLGKAERHAGQGPCVAANELAPRSSGCFLSTVGSQGQAGDIQQFTGTVPANATFKATLTWLRHPKLPALQKIHLFLYKNVNNGWVKVMDDSTSAIDNVRQVFDQPTAQTEYLVKVKSVQAFDATTPSEQFGLATSHAFKHFAGPEVSINCTPPQSVQPSQVVSVPCTATNRGQLSLYNAVATSSPGTVGNGNLGTIDPGASASFTVTATAPSQSGASFLVAVNVSGTLADETYKGTGGFTLITQSTNLNCTFSVTPAGIIVPYSMSGISGTFQLTTQSGCSWNVYPSALTILVGQVISWNWVTVSPMSGTGSATISFTVPANNWVGALAPAGGSIGIGQLGNEDNAFFGIRLCGDGPAVNGVCL